MYFRVQNYKMFSYYCRPVHTSVIDEPNQKNCTFAKIFRMKQVAIIAAIGERGELGFQNQLLCHLPHDLKRFKELTLEHPVVMGRNTWESLPIKPLPRRRNYVLSSQNDLNLVGATLFHSVDDVMNAMNEDETLFVMGGASVYQQFMPIADIIYLTRILAEFTADVFFPTFSPEQWSLHEDQFVPRDDKNPFDCRFQTLLRIY